LLFDVSILTLYIISVNMFIYLFIKKSGDFIPRPLLASYFLVVEWTPFAGRAIVTAFSALAFSELDILAAWIVLCFFLRIAKFQGRLSAFFHCGKLVIACPT
jgi:hypothetical protein